MLNNIIKKSQELFKKIFSTKKRIIAGIIVLVIFIGIGVKNNKAGNGTCSVAEYKKITEVVSISGKVRPVEDIKLSFERSGRIAYIPVKVGDKVSRGAILAAIESSQLSSQLAQSQAQFEGQRVKLQELQRGSRKEDIDIAQTKVDNAQTNLTQVSQKATIDLGNEYDSGLDEIKDAYTKANDAVRRYTDEIFVDDETLSPRLSYNSGAYQSKIRAESARASLGPLLDKWNSEIKLLQSEGDIDTALQSATTYLLQIRSFLGDVEETLNAGSDLSQVSLTSYKTSVGTAQANIVTALSSISAQKQSISAQKITNQNNISTAQSALSVAQRELQLKQAGSTPEEIAFQSAQVNRAYADVLYYQSELGKTTLRAPISGIVTAIDIDPGEMAAVGTQAVALMSEGAFEIEAFISESDIGKIRVGQEASVTLDAYGEHVVFLAHVVRVDPAETSIDGVASYKTILMFDKEDARIKSGMTAQTTITTGVKEKALALSYACVSFDEKNQPFVFLKNGERISVGLGISGSDGSVEILSGLQNKQKVLYPQEIK